MLSIETLDLDSLKTDILTVKKFLTVKKLTSQQSWCSTAGVLNLLVLAYPQIRIVSPLHTPKSKLYPFAYPPNQNFYPNELVLSGFQNLAYPLWASHVPLGVRIPQVENRCSKASIFDSLDQDYPSQQFKKWHLDCWGILDSLKTDISAAETCRQFKNWHLNCWHILTV
jgi:hypothetical protein